MKLDSVGVGTWIPRTDIHVKEFFDAIKTGKSPHKFTSDEVIAKLVASLGARDLSYTLEPPAAFIFFWGEIQGVKVEARFYQDGVLCLKTKINKKDFGVKEVFGVVNNLRDFYEVKLKPFLNEVYGAGAPTPRLAFQAVELNVIINSPYVSEAEEKEVFEFNDDILVTKKRKPGLRFLVGRRTLLVVSRNSQKLLENFFHFMFDYKETLNIVLLSHRQVWQQIREIRDTRYIKISEIPGFRDQLMKLSNTIMIVDSRLKQMKGFLSSKKLLLDDLRDEFLRAYLGDEISILRSNHNYMMHLWNMTSEYCDTTIKVLNMVYRESEQDQFKILQVLFTISAVAGIIGLGGVVGSVTRFYTQPENVLSIITYQTAWNFKDFFVFGGVAVFLALCLTWLVRYSFHKLKTLTRISYLREESLERKIKKPRKIKLFP